MQELEKSFKNTGNIHHAYFLVGNNEKIKTELFDFFEKRLKIKTLGNPDFLYLKYDGLNIEDARLISELQTKRNIGEKMIFVIDFNFISIESQNSLLKVIEEPTEDTHFFFISNQNTFLPALLSRVQTIKTEYDDSDNFSHKSILNLSFKERLDLVKKITDSISDEDGTKQDAINFLNEIEKELYKNGVEKSLEDLKICEKARESLYDRGAPVKMILESVVISI